MTNSDAAWLHWVDPSNWMYSLDERRWLYTCMDGSIRKYASATLSPEQLVRLQNSIDDAIKLPQYDYTPVTSSMVTTTATSVPQGNPEEHPAHYGGDTVYEVFKVVEAWGLDKDAYLFNVVKYVARAGKKDSSKAGMLKDLRKALVYLQRKIANLEKE